MDNTTPTPMNDAMRVAQAQDAVKAIVAAKKSETPMVAAKPVIKLTEAVATSESDVTDPKISDAFARLGKQETHLREERAKIESAKKNHESALKQAEQFNALQELVRDNPLKALETLGLSYEQLTNHVRELQNPLDPRMKQLFDRQSKLEAERASEKKAMEQEKIQRAEKQVSDNIDKHFVMPEYEVLTKVRGSKEAVREFMETVYNETGKIPEYKEACQAVLDHVADVYSQISNHPSLQRKEAVTEAPVIRQETRIEESKPKSKGGRLAPVADDPNVKGLTESERLQLAIKAVSAMKK